MDVSHTHHTHGPVEGHAATVIDPVCGITVDHLTTAHHAGHAGRAYHFCSADCRTKFQADPNKSLVPKTSALDPTPPQRDHVDLCIHREPARGLCGTLPERHLRRSGDPGRLAVIGDLVVTEEGRARRLTFVSLADISGFLLGPMMGFLVARGAGDIFSRGGSAGALALPLAGTAILALLVAAAAAFAVPGTKAGDPTSKRPPPAASPRWLIPRLFCLAFFVSGAVGVFEVGLALRGKQELGLSQYQIALMFTECSLVMLVVQAIVFSPWTKPRTTRLFIAPALVVLAVGLFLVPLAPDFALMLAVIGAVAASGGILSPILT